MRLSRGSLFFFSLFLMIIILPDYAHSAVKIGARNVAATPLSKGTIFVSPEGTGTGRSESDPCNLSDFDLYHAKIKVKPGDVIFFRGGIYRFSMQGVRRVYLEGGTAHAPVTYESYPGETAIFDGSAMSTSDTKKEEWREGRLHLRGEYAILRKVEVRNMPTYGVRILGNHNIVEGCTLHHNYLSGLGIVNIIDSYSTKDTGGSYNIVRDNVSHHNSDAGLKHHNYNDGDNADGIVIHCGVGNLISHNTIYSNSDDGIDIWKSMNSTVEYNLVYDHGKGPRGNGNGIKLGGAGKDSPLGANGLASHNISFSNKMSGFNINGGKNVTMKFNTAYNNGDYGFTLMKDTVLISNLAIQNKSGHFGWSKGKKQTNNSWQLEKKSEAISFEPASINFLKPHSGSGLANLGAYAKEE